MKSKQDIVENWLPRYTGKPLTEFGEYILLTNFDNYVTLFSEWLNVPVDGLDRAMRSATAEGITIINFGMGSPNAATIKLRTPKTVIETGGSVAPAPYE